MKSFTMFLALFFPLFTFAQLAIPTSSSLPNAKVGQPYAALINTSGVDTSNGYFWTVNNGSAGFPVTGLGFNSSYGSSNSIVGTPAKIYVNGVEQTVPYTFAFNVSVNSGSETATKQFTLTVDPATYSTTKGAPIIDSVRGAGPNGEVIPGSMMTINGRNFSAFNYVVIGGFSSKLSSEDGKTIMTSAPLMYPGESIVSIEDSTRVVISNVFPFKIVSKIDSADQQKNTQTMSEVQRQETIKQLQALLASLIQQLMMLLQQQMSATN